MRWRRRLRILGGAAAVVAALAATVWVLVPGGTAPGRGHTLNPALAAAELGGTAGPDADVTSRAVPLVILPDKVDLSQPLRDIAPIQPVKREETLIRWNEVESWSPAGEVSPGAVDPNLQDWSGVEAMPTPIVSWEGTGNVSGVLPPDTQGDVGPNHYVQWVNLAYTIYDKSGTKLYGPANGNTLWSGFDDICANNNDGDPITLYDYLADRWFMSQFVIDSTSYQCIAVSQTGDPTGSWYRYRYTWPNNYINDYPHFGMLSDAYYMTTNQFNSAGNSYTGAGVAAFERSKMLAGATATMVYFNLGTNYGGQLPADIDGWTEPPAGAPGLILEWDDSSSTDYLRIWKVTMNWTTPGNSTCTLSQSLATTNLDGTVCTASRSRCVPQPGTTYKLEAISDRLMHRVQYRNFGGYQTLVGSHTVDTNNPAGTAGIHWFELRNTGSNWSIHQQGTYAPDTTIHRWMGSIAMDQNGNIALGFSVSNGGSVYPGVRYVGRLSGDPLGTLPQSETVMQAGGGSQTYSSYGRWGDYSAMQIDNSDGCTFWYTQEYYSTTSNANWQTRIGAFSFPGCSPTAVEMERFEAWPDAPAIHVQWETAQETDNLGFNLYRSNTRKGMRIKLNADLIPSQVAPGSPFGVVYDYVDGYRVRSGRVYFYWLESMGTTGAPAMHGPVRVRMP